MVREINYTNITLFPKLPHAFSVKQYRPISCYLVVYKLTSRVIPNRFKKVISDIINHAQSGFIPQRQILDNVLLASELIKGCGRKGLGHRWMIKIDLKKAYDSVERPFFGNNAKRTMDS